MYIRSIPLSQQHEGQAGKRTYFLSNICRDVSLHTSCFIACSLSFNFFFTSSFFAHFTAGPNGATTMTITIELAAEKKTRAPGKTPSLKFITIFYALSTPTRTTRPILQRWISMTHANIQFNTFTATFVRRRRVWAERADAAEKIQLQGLPEIQSVSQSVFNVLWLQRDYRV